MRLKSVYISQYKNLKDFTLSFDGASFIDVFVGKNGTGKSNIFEALIEIFRHLYEFDKGSKGLDFDYRISFEIDDNVTEVAWISGQLSINGRERNSIGQTPMPDNVLIYYSGHNDTVSGLVKKYEGAFRKRIKKADFGESRRFIGIGAVYKELLLSVLLMQKEGNKAGRYIRDKLGIKSIAPEIKLVLKRPLFAKKKFEIDDFDPKTHFWGAEGITKIFLEKLFACIKGEFKHGDIYNRSLDFYSILINIELFHSYMENENIKVPEVFSQFDNLKSLEMLQEIDVPVTLENGSNASIAHFSDGQVQTVYIYSIIELFKDRNCITLLDEPDAFLHPEWQFDFLKQVFEITETAGKKNHVLMSSHSASTITTSMDTHINLFEINGNKIVVNRISKANVIKSLSAGLITFSEHEARLSIHHVLNNTSGAVLFTEGITDEMILETAWSKLYPAEPRNFEIQNAFSCGFLRNLMKDQELYQNYQHRTFFSLFDFDEAFNDWNQLGLEIQSDPCKCLTKKFGHHESYALLLPVPSNPVISKQVINPNTGATYGNKSLLTIELLFYGITDLESYFGVDVERTDGFIKFMHDKVGFAKDIVPTLDSTHFEIFRPMFEFIKSKC